MNNALEQLISTIHRFVSATVRHRWTALFVMLASSLTASAGLMLYDNRYEASARVYVDTQSVLKPMMASLTYQPDMEQQVGMLARTLISRPNVERLVAQQDLQIGAERGEDRDAMITRLMKQIKIIPTATGNLYDISYRGSSPERARRLVTATVDLFVAAAAGEKRRDAQDAGRFIEEQIRAHEVKLVEAEENLKAFRIRNFGLSGVSDKDYFTRVSTATEQVSRLRAELLAAERSREAYRRELANEDPLLPSHSAAQEPLPGEMEAERRLDAHRRVLDELQARYTDSHPDVIAGRRTLARLEREALEARAERLDYLALKRASTGGGAAATSPVYQKLRISLAEAEAAVASLESQLGTKEVQLIQVRALANRAPQVEAEHAQLNRDYDIIRKNYDTLVARRESASLGAKLDESSKLTEFRVVEPPRVSLIPVFPSRLHLALLAVLASIVLGVLAAQLVDSIAPTFDDINQLRRSIERPLLGSVAMMLTPSMATRRRRKGYAYASALSLILCAQGLWLGWLASTPVQW